MALPNHKFSSSVYTTIASKPPPGRQPGGFVSFMGVRETPRGANLDSVITLPSGWHHTPVSNSGALTGIG